MQFDTILDMTYRFEELTTEQVQQLLSYVAGVALRLHDTLYWKHYEIEDRGAYHIDLMRCYLSIKGTTNDERYQIKRYIEKQDLPLISTTEQRLCENPRCWNEVVADQHKIALFDQYGENLHEIQFFCEHHIQPASSQIVSTIRIKDLPDENIWRVDGVRVTSWQGENDLGRSWYSQRIWNETDGDYESSYYDYTTASPHLGPFETRTLAVIAAQDWESEY